MLSLPLALLQDLEIKAKAFVITMHARPFVSLAGRLKSLTLMSEESDLWGIGPAVSQHLAGSLTTLDLRVRELTGHMGGKAGVCEGAAQRGGRSNCQTPPQHTQPPAWVHEARPVVRLVQGPCSTPTFL